VLQAIDAAMTTASSVTNELTPSSRAELIRRLTWACEARAKLEAHARRQARQVGLASTDLVEILEALPAARARHQHQRSGLQARSGRFIVLLGVLGTFVMPVAVAVRALRPLL